MGTKSRPRPANLSRKLRHIRINLKLSQLEIVRRLGFGDSFHVGRISEYESNTREPSLLVLLAYARLARIHLEDIVDDAIDLPNRLPGRVFYERPD
jgi:transcriptional regulator with XRE-family HTH domain